MARQRRQSRLRALRRHLAPPTPTAGGGGAAPLARTKAHTFDVALMHDPRPYLPAEDPPSAHQPELTAEEVERFKQTGVICKRQLLPAAPLRRWVDRLWAEAVPAVIDRADRSTWVDVAERWTCSEPANIDAADVEGSSRLGADGILHHCWDGDAVKGGPAEPAFVADTSAHPKVLAIVEGLIGAPLRRPTRTRGIYSIWPRSHSGRPSAQLSPHLDTETAQLLATVYLDRVGPSDGCFTVWPGSHRIMYDASDDEINWAPNDRYQPLLRRVKEEVQPRALTGGCGDVFFWHPRTVRTPPPHRLLFGM